MAVGSFHTVPVNTWVRRTILLQQLLRSGIRVWEHLFMAFGSDDAQPRWIDKPPTIAVDLAICRIDSPEAVRAKEGKEYRRATFREAAAFMLRYPEALKDPAHHSFAVLEHVLEAWMPLFCYTPTPQQVLFQGQPLFLGDQGLSCEIDEYGLFVGPHAHVLLVRL